MAMDSLILLARDVAATNCTMVMMALITTSPIRASRPGATAISCSCFQPSYRIYTSAFHLTESLTNDTMRCTKATADHHRSYSNIDLIILLFIDKPAPRSE
uniref:Secreted protein n=1 Tax=Ascaris lumbricoides TaxID=6252 RepID=A0A0M3HJ59_ASCLU